MTMDKSLDAINTKLAKALGYVDKIDKATKNIAANSTAASKGVTGMAAGGGPAAGGRGGANVGNATFSTPVPASKNPTMQPAGGGGGAGGPSGGAGGSGGGGGKGNMLSAGLGIVGATATAAWGITPGVRDYAANQAALFPTAFSMAGTYSNARAKSAIASGIGMGASGVFDPKAAAAMGSMSGLSFNMGAAGGGTALGQSLGGASFAYQMMGMSNQSAMQGQIGMYQGGGPGAALAKIGIFTADMNSGKPKDMGQIVDDLWARFYGSKNAKITMEQFDGDLLMGFLGADLRAMFGSSPELYAQVVSFMRVKARAGGRAGMRVAGSRNNVADVARGLGMNEFNTPTIKAGETAAARAGSVDIATDSGMQGYVTGQDAITNVNKGMQGLYEILGPVSEALTTFKSYLDTFVSSGEGSSITGLVTGILKSVVPFARGGTAFAGGGTSTSDSVNAKLSHGEYVINARAAQQIGVRNLDAMNSAGHALGSAYASPVRSFAGGGWVNPFPGSTTSSGYGPRNGTTHHGTDLNFPGDEDTNHYVLAMRDGKVIEVAYDDSVGGQVRLQHDGGYQSRYVHLNYDSIGVSNGQTVTAGQQLARIGAHGVGRQNTGSLSSGPHLHVEIKKDGSLIDPATILRSAGVMAGTPSPGAGSDGTDTPSTPDGEEPKSKMLKSTPGASIPEGLTSLAYSSVMGTSLAGLGKAGTSMGSFGSGYVDAASVGKNSLLSMRSSGSSGSSGSVSSGGSVMGGRSTTMSGSSSPSAAAPPSGSLSDWLTAAGFTGEHHREAWAIAMRESGGRPTAHNPVPPDDSYGLFQINMLGSLEAARNAKFRQYVPGYVDKQSLFDPLINAKAAAYMSQKGRNWASWVSPQYGRAKEYYDQYAASASAGMSTTHAGVVNVHEGEMIIPATQANDFRDALREALNGGKRRGGDTYITLKIEKASDEEARRFAKQVKRLLEDDAAMERLGTK